MEKVKFGLIGCGRISAKHFEAIDQIEDAEIIACADIIKKRAMEAAEKYKVKSVYTDYTKMLKAEELDAVIICTPSGLHPRIEIGRASCRERV